MLIDDDKDDSDYLDEEMKRLESETDIKQNHPKLNEKLKNFLHAFDDINQQQEFVAFVVGVWWAGKEN